MFTKYKLMCLSSKFLQHAFRDKVFDFFIYYIVEFEKTV